VDEADERLVGLSDGNLLSGLPSQPLVDEMVETLLERPGVRIERIVSTGQATPAGEWLDQASDEWVMVVAGRARLSIEGEGRPRAWHRRLRVSPRPLPPSRRLD
jgi:hypothetical protein